MKTKTKYLHQALLTAGIVASYSGLALGIHSSELALKCAGTLEITGIEHQSISTPFYDRGGNYHPAHGYATFKVAVKDLGAECADIKQQLKIDIGAIQFTSFQTFPVSDLAKLETLTAKQIGKTAPFTTKQYFGYKDQQGYLPFYPLISQQTLTLQSAIGVQRNSQMTAAPAKEFLYEEDKLELTAAIFKYLEDTQYAETALNDTILYPLVTMHPEFSSNFKPYLANLLKVFGIYENKKSKNEFFDFPLSTLAKQIAALTKEYPEYYEFNIPQLVAEHPSLLNQYGDLPNLTAQDLEETLVILQTQLSAGQVSEKVKNNFHQPLKVIAGHTGFDGGQLTKITSQQSEETADAILKKFY